MFIIKKLLPPPPHTHPTHRYTPQHAVLTPRLSVPVRTTSTGTVHYINERRSGVAAADFPDAARRAEAMRHCLNWCSKPDINLDQSETSAELRRFCYGSHEMNVEKLLPRFNSVLTFLERNSLMSRPTTEYMRCIHSVEYKISAGSKHTLYIYLFLHQILQRLAMPSWRLCVWETEPIVWLSYQNFKVTSVPTRNQRCVAFLSPHGNIW
jgi:hypothetical protein